MSEYVIYNIIHYLKNIVNYYLIKNFDGGKIYIKALLIILCILETIITGKAGTYNAFGKKYVSTKVPPNDKVNILFHAFLTKCTLLFI